MVLFKNVRATVIRYDDKKPYHEYKVTQQPSKRSPTLKEAYVEVVSGERFAVVVELLSTFDFQSAPDVLIRCQVDGMGYSTTCISRKQATSTHMGTEIPTFQPKTLSCDVRKIDGKWMKCGLVFADLQLDEDAEPTADQISRTMSTCGIITIDITRGTRETIQPQLWRRPNIPEVTSASKDIVKKRHVSTTVKMLGLEELDHHPFGDSKFTPSETNGSAPLRINLLYRSRSALELLKVIPTTYPALHSNPSPPTVDDRRAAVGTLPVTAPHSPLDVVSNAGQLAHKKHGARDLPIDVDSDAQQPVPKKTKTKIDADNLDLASATEYSRPPPHVRSEDGGSRINAISADDPPVPQSNAPPSADPSTIKPSPVVIKEEDADDDLVIMGVNPISRVHPTRTQAQTQAPMASAQHGEQTQRQRKKAILKMRLEQLKIDREQLKIEQELLEMKD